MRLAGFLAGVLYEMMIGPKRPRTEKLEIIDSLRGLGAIYVFTSHLVLERLALKRHPITYLLRMQEVIAVFLGLSGFVTQYSMKRGQHLSATIYLKKRALRIYPIYICSLILSRILCRANSRSTTKTLIGNLFMLHDLKSAKPGVWFPPFCDNEPLWSLSYEWWCSMLFIPMRQYVRPALQLHAAAAISMIGFVSYQIAPNQISLFLLYFIIWWGGAELAKAYPSGGMTFSSQRALVIYLGAFLILIGTPALRAIYRRSALNPGKYPVLQFRHFLGAVTFLALALAWKPGRRPRMFSVFAPFSYALYLFHYPLAIRASYLSFVRSAKVQTISYVGVTFLAAYLAEVRLQPWLAQRFLRQELRLLDNPIRPVTVNRDMHCAAASYSG